jgi:hypothetical protein
MSLVTIGLDFGTSSIKCVARPGMARNDRVEVLPSSTMALRWRSMMGKVWAGEEAGRLLLFEECDDEQWRFGAVLEPNLKLALLASPDSPTASALRSRWECESHYALPTLLLGAALQQSYAAVRRRWPGHAVHVYAGAPVSPAHPTEQTRNFERALFAAHQLTAKWGDEVPCAALDGLRAAERAWKDSEVLPELDERTTFVVPEAFAACEGVASVGGDVPLPVGRLCIVDMGGGTTDIAWVSRSGHDSYNPLRIDSFDIAGERLEAVIAAKASSMARRWVRRSDIWHARRSWSESSQQIEGDGWSFSMDELRAALKPTFAELAAKVARSIQEIDAGVAKAPPTTFVFVGGATQWDPLARIFLESVEEFHDRVEVVTVRGFGLARPVDDIPLAVALGLSTGRSRLDPERWGRCLQAVESSPLEAINDHLPMCACKGLLWLCPQCGGSGVRDGAHGGSRFAATLDPFLVHAFPVRCPHCQVDFPRDRIFEHLATTHSSPILPPPRPQNPTWVSEFSIDQVRMALRNGDTRRLAPVEVQLVSDLRWLHLGCLSEASLAQSIATAFLRMSVVWSERHRWGHLPRAIAFAILGDRDSMRKELKSAETAGLGYCRMVASILSSERETRFAEAWECMLR